MSAAKSTPLTLLCLTLLIPVQATAQGTTSYSENNADENGGRVTGHVLFDGRVPEPLQLLITKDMEVCGEGYRERKEIDTTDGLRLRNVVVFIEEINSGKPWSSMHSGTQSRNSINQENCFFRPHVQVIRRGTEVDVINSDSTLHNIHAYELIGRARRSLFNISQPELGSVQQILDPGRGNHVSLECDSHDFMQGWIFVADHPYATVVDETGSFEISDIPPGTYALSAWHPRLGVLTQDVHVSMAVAEGDATAVEFTFNSE